MLRSHDILFIMTYATLSRQEIFFPANKSQYLEVITAHKIRSCEKKGGHEYIHGMPLCQHVKSQQGHHYRCERKKINLPQPSQVENTCEGLSAKMLLFVLSLALSLKDQPHDPCWAKRTTKSSPQNDFLQSIIKLP